MKRALVVLLVAVMLLTAGCGAAEKTVETMTDFKWGASESEIRAWHSSELEEINKKEFETALRMENGKYSGYDCNILYSLKRGGLTTVYYDFLEENQKNKVAQYKKLKEMLEKKYGAPLLEEANAGANMEYSALWDAEGIHVFLSLNSSVFFLSYTDLAAEELAEKLTEEDLQRRADEEARIAAEAEAAALKKTEEAERQKLRDEYQGVTEGDPYISLDNYSEDVKWFVQSNGVSLTLVYAEVAKLAGESGEINSAELPQTLRDTMHDTLKGLKAAFLGAIKLDVNGISQKHKALHEQLLMFCEASIAVCDYIHETIVVADAEYNQAHMSARIAIMTDALQGVADKIQ